MAVTFTPAGLIWTSGTAPDPAAVRAKLAWNCSSHPL
jgi:hypothetical protein